MKKKIKIIITLIFSLDVLIILLNLLYGRENRYLNLDQEYGLSAYYSSGKLILVGTLSLIVFYLLKKYPINQQKAKVWIPFAFLFIYLGFDEMLGIHEKVIFEVDHLFAELGWYSNHVFYWVPLFLPLILTAIIYLMYFERQLASKFKNSRKLFIYGIFLFSGVIVTEVIGGFLSGSQGFYLMTIEEIMEIIGTTLFLSGTVLCLLDIEKSKN